MQMRETARERLSASNLDKLLNLEHVKWSIVLCFTPIVDTSSPGGGKFTVRPCREEGVDSCQDLMRRHHYFKGRRNAGDTLRCMAELDGDRVALLTWGSAAYGLKTINPYLTRFLTTLASPGYFCL
jgi:hypothetical protein